MKWDSEAIAWVCMVVCWAIAFVIALLDREVWHAFLVANFGSYFLGVALYAHYNDRR